MNQTVPSTESSPAADGSLGGAAAGASADALAQADGNRVDADTTRHRSRSLRNVQQLAALVMCGGIVGAVIHPRGVAFSVTLCAFVVYLVAWAIRSEI